jgi:hypothetical protein
MKHEGQKQKKVTDNNVPTRWFFIDTIACKQAINFFQAGGDENISTTASKKLATPIETNKQTTIMILPGKQQAGER